jgi:ferrous iron transport protein A
MDNLRGVALSDAPDQDTPFICLDAVPRARRAQLVRLCCDSLAIRKLAELGIVVGAILSLQRSAPLGGPVLVDVQGSQVALGRRLARQMLVRVLP